MELYEQPLEIENEHEHLTVDLDLLEKILRQTIAGEGFTLTYLGILLSDHATIHEMNREHLGHDYETDVLSFPLLSPSQVAHRKTVEGEVYVDLDTAFERAPEFGSTFQEEAFRYVVHGLLHIIGYDDATDEERTHMRRLEDRYLGLPEAD